MIKIVLLIIYKLKCSQKYYHYEQISFKKEMFNYSETELLLAASFTALVGYLTYFTVNIYILRKKYAHIPGPPANGLIGFYFGNLFEINHNLRSKKRVTSQLILDWLLYFFNLKIIYI